LDRANGQLTTYNLLADEQITFDRHGPEDLVIDNENNLLYCPVFYDPGDIFYGLLEMNLTTQTKRWITTASSPVSITGPVLNEISDELWGVHKIYLDEMENVLYFSTGNGLWWWDRDNDATGLYTTSGGIPLGPTNPQLPSNLTTGMFMDSVENKFYIGTHEGLYVWDRNNNTSRIYNTENSKLRHNLINHIDKSDELNLLFVSCEHGGLFTINTATGEEKAIFTDIGSEVYPQYMDTSAASAFYDEIDKKLYVSADHPTGGVWIQDYNNLVPDYGDLRLSAGSPAIDRGDPAYLPSSITLDILGSNRWIDYATLFGDNSLDLGAHEKTYDSEEAPSPAIPDSLGLNYVLSYDVIEEGITDENTIDNYPVTGVNKSIQYLDGLGRPNQSISIQGSPTRSDIIQPIVYDEYGREQRKYLPFTSGNTGIFNATENIIDSLGHYAGAAQSFYGASNGTIAGDARPFSETMFEPSPLNRPTKNYGPGLAWSQATGGADKPVQYQYLTNVHNLMGSLAEEAIIAWKVDSTGSLTVEQPTSGYIVSGGYYSSNQLYVQNTIDEHGNTVREYTNKHGQVILKKVQAASGSTDLNDVDEWACTYYVYDDFGNLAFVLPPEGVKQYLSVTQQP
jgi:hypothetical protein